MAAQLRVYRSPEETRFHAPEPTVRIRLADLLPLIALAKKQNYAWLQDFLEDEVHVTEDLYEVLETFRCYRPSA